MFLAIDIGNTNITFGVYETTLKFVCRMATDTHRTADQYAMEFCQILHMNGARDNDFDKAIISSVVPRLTRIIKKAVEKTVNVSPLILSTETKTGLDIQIDNPSQLGADLIATAVGAISKYPLPCLIADLGTATKISVIEQNSVFKGCTIAPGVGLSLSALSSGAAQLPSLDITGPEKAIGTNTVTSMQSGIVYGTAEMLDGMFDRIGRELSSPAKSFVATGGWAYDIVKYCRHNIIFDENLILDGLFAVVNQK